MVYKHGIDVSTFLIDFIITILIIFRFRYKTFNIKAVFFLCKGQASFCMAVHLLDDSSKQAETCSSDTNNVK